MSDRRLVTSRSSCFESSTCLGPGKRFDDRAKVPSARPVEHRLQAASPPDRTEVHPFQGSHTFVGERPEGVKELVGQ